MIRGQECLGKFFVFTVCGEVMGVVVIVRPLGVGVVVHPLVEVVGKVHARVQKRKVFAENNCTSLTKHKKISGPKINFQPRVILANIQCIHTRHFAKFRR